MKNRFSLSVFLFLSAISFHLVAQRVTWSQPFVEDKKMQYFKITGTDEEGFYLLRSNYSLDNGDHSGSKNKKYVLEYFDLGMRLKWSHPLASSVPEARIIAVQSVNTKILVLSAVTEKPTKRYRIFAQYINSMGSYESQPLLLDEFGYEKINDDNRPDILVSHDQSKAVCAFRKISDDKKEDQVYEAIVVDTNLQVLYKKEMAIPLNEKHFATMDFVLTDAGDFFLLGIKFLTGKKVKAPNESFYQLYSYNYRQDLVSSNEIKIEDKFLTDVGVAADNLNKKVVVAGFYSDQTTYSTAGVFYYSVNEDTTSQTVIKSTPFNSAFLSKFLGERKINNRELVDYSIDRLILRKDGGAAILAESFYQTTSSYFDYFTQSYVSHRYYHFGNIIALSVNPDGNILWGNSVSKDQNSTDDGGYLSSYCSVITQGKIYAIYNKYIEQESSVLISYIDSNGKQNTDVLFNELKNISIVPRSAKQIDAETLLLPAYRENKFYITKIEF
jgi:hypothetical protein